MEGTYLKGNLALERLGDLTELICIEAHKKGLDNDDPVLDGLLLKMGDALNRRDIKEAKQNVVKMLSEVLGYDTTRATFVMKNHLNKNAGWD